MLRRAAAALALAALAALCWFCTRGVADTVATPQAHRASEVPLVGANGSRLRLAEGPRLVVFGYAGCADRCPLTLRMLTRGLRSAGGARLPRVTFVDVDPWHDSRPVVARYVAHIAGVEGATGDPAALVANEAALGMVPVRTPDDVAGHDTRIFVLDDEGVLVRTLTTEELSRRTSGITGTKARSEWTFSN